VHSSKRGDVLSSQIPTAAGMALQCLGWLHSVRDGYTGPKVMGGDALHWLDVTVLSRVGAG
jgi:hypothetical protein